MRRNLPALILLAVLAGGCGDAPQRDAPVQWMQAKPGRVAARLEAAVTERPAPDRVRVDARWVAGTLEGACTLDIGLPAGVLIVEGEERLDLDADDPGSASWVLEFPRDGRDLDAVVRYCVDTPDGLRAAHVAVRLTR